MAVGAGDEPRAPQMVKRGRDEVDWEEDVGLADFCADTVRFIGDASRPELRSFWRAWDPCSMYWSIGG